MSRRQHFVELRAQGKLINYDLNNISFSFKRKRSSSESLPSCSISKQTFQCDESSFPDINVVEVFEDEDEAVFGDKDVKVRVRDKGVGEVHGDKDGEEVNETKSEGEEIGDKLVREDVGNKGAGEVKMETRMWWK